MTGQNPSGALLNAMGFNFFYDAGVPAPTVRCSAATSRTQAPRRTSTTASEHRNAHRGLHWHWHPPHAGDVWWRTWRTLAAAFTVARPDVFEGHYSYGGQSFVPSWGGARACRPGGAGRHVTPTLSRRSPRGAVAVQFAAPRDAGSVEGEGVNANRLLSGPGRGARRVVRRRPGLCVGCFDAVDPGLRSLELESWPRSTRPAGARDHFARANKLAADDGGILPARTWAGPRLNRRRIVRGSRRAWASSSWAPG